MTIYALSSGAGISGVAVIRISGEKTKDIIRQITGREFPQPRIASLNNIRVTQINPGIVKTPFYNNLKISPGTKYDEFIEPNDIAKIVIEVLKMRSGSVIDEINLTSQKQVINFKSK